MPEQVEIDQKSYMKEVTAKAEELLAIQHKYALISPAVTKLAQVHFEKGYMELEGQKVQEVFRAHLIFIQPIEGQEELETPIMYGGLSTEVPDKTN